MREVLLTADGSATLRHAASGETYHSLQGAEMESQYVFLQNGLMRAAEDHSGPLAVLEIGLGSGLNALLSWRFAVRQERQVNYTGLEPFPLEPAEVEQLRFPCLEPEPGWPGRDALAMLHKAGSEGGTLTQPFFDFDLLRQPLQSAVLPQDTFHVVFYDAFSPASQPELWQPWVWDRLLPSMKSGAVLVTYSATGAVRRAWMQAGLTVERLPGAGKKRHMLRGFKPRHKASGIDRAYTGSLA